MNMKKLATVAAVIGLFAGMASAASIVPSIEAISGTVVQTDYIYNAVSGSGVLTIKDTLNTDIVVQYVNNTQDTYDDGTWSLKTELAWDNSSDGRAMADFAGGTIELKDGAGNLLFQADLVELTLEESTESSMVLLNGSGTFSNATGDLAELFTTSGQVIEIAYSLPDLTDFQSDFSAQSNVTLIPEPATMSVLALGGLALLLRKRST